MLRAVIRIYHALRVLGTALAVAVTVFKLAGGTMISSLPHALQDVLTRAWLSLSSWPVYAIALLLAGSWLQDGLDAMIRSREGADTWLGHKLLAARLRFTRWIIPRPKMYRNESKIIRELERADETLKKAGFATLAGLPVGKAEDHAAALDYLRAIEALLGSVGSERAAQLSYPLKKALGSVESTEAPAPAERANPPVEISQPPRLLRFVRRLIGRTT